MKLIRLATIAALSTTMLAGGVQAFAEESRSVNTENDITFTSDGDEEVVVQPPVTEPEVGPIEPTPPGQTGPLTIAYAPKTISFGTHAISTQNQAYSMIAEEQPLIGGGTTPYVSFAQVQDTRGSHEGWTLGVSLSDFVSAKSNNTLAGAQIELANPSIVYNNGEGNQELKPTANTNQGTSLFLNVGDDNVLVMNAAETQGAGTSSVVWGDQADLNAQAADEEVEVVENHAIRLHVPGSTAQDAAAYTATMNWQLASTPDLDGELVPEEE
ncbi:MAG: WxL domain-containing protein [Enterococcus casseliflavus]|nr:WxL domain-containing protein [Enterococcus casseliflavus]